MNPLSRVLDLFIALGGTQAAVIVAGGVVAFSLWKFLGKTWTTQPWSRWDLHRFVTRLWVPLFVLGVSVSASNRIEDWFLSPTERFLQAKAIQAFVFDLNDTPEQVINLGECGSNPDRCLRLRFEGYKSKDGVPFAYFGLGGTWVPGLDNRIPGFPVGIGVKLLKDCQKTLYLSDGRVFEIVIIDDRETSKFVGLRLVKMEDTNAPKLPAGTSPESQMTLWASCPRDPHLPFCD